MSRTAEKAKCNETDIITLEEMRDGTAYPEAMRRRARVILLSHGGMMNKDIAAEVPMSAYWVGQWVRRFNEGGVDALRDLPRSGRRGNAAPADVASEVESLLASPPPEGEEAWTAPLLASRIGVSEQSVRNAARAAGATIERRRVWEVETSGEPVARAVDVAALFLSGGVRALVLSVGAEAPGSSAGALTTRNGSLASDLARVASPTLADALDLAAEHAADGRRIAHADLGRFLDGVLSAPPGPPGSIWSVLLLCDEGSARGLLRRPNVQVTLAADEAGWDVAFGTLASVACGGGAAAAELGRALAGWVGARVEGTEDFLWSRACPDPGGTRGDEAGAPAEAGGGGGDAVDGDIGGGGDAGRDDAIPSPRQGAGARITVEYLGSDGRALSTSSVEVGGLMDPSSCDTSSRESVAAFVSDLERTLLPAIDAAGRELGGAALAATKKNSR